MSHRTLSTTPDRYVIAIKRTLRAAAPSDWLDRIEGLEGLSIVGKPRFGRALVEASPEALEQVRLLLGEYCHIEPVTWHRPSDKGSPWPDDPL